MAQDFFQGVTLSRYRTDHGDEYHVINASDLSTLLLATPLEDLAVERLAEGNYLKNSLQADDVLIAARGSELRASVVTPQHAGCLAGANLTVFRPLKNARGHFSFVHPLYLAGLFGSQWMKGLLTRIYMQSSNVQLVTLKQLKELELPLPPLDLQALLADLFLTFEDYGKTLSETLEARGQLVEAALQRILGDSHADA